MPEFTLEQIMTIVLVVVFFIIIVAILVALKVAGTGFFFAGCEAAATAEEDGRGAGEAGIEGVRCSGIVNGTNITVGRCGANLTSVQAIANPRCTGFRTFSSCIFTYKPVEREEQKLQVCLSAQGADLPQGVSCLMNAEITCEDFSQSTVPRCQEVPGCRPVNVIERAIDGLRRLRG